MDTSNPSRPTGGKPLPPPLPTFANEPTIELSAADLEPGEGRLSTPPEPALTARTNVEEAASAAAEPASAPQRDAEEHAPEPVDAKRRDAANRPSTRVAPFWTTHRVLVLAVVASGLTGTLVYLATRMSAGDGSPAAPAMMLDAPAADSSR